MDTTTRPGGLVLTRSPGERIVIGDGWIVEVVEVRTRGTRAAVRLRVVAPKGVAIDREEVHASKQAGAKNRSGRVTA